MGWVFNATPWSLYPRESPFTHCIGGWVGPRAGLKGCGKCHLIGIRSSDRPARSQSLYLLSYLSRATLSYRYMWLQLMQKFIITGSIYLVMKLQNVLLGPFYSKHITK
jgi:hypothetical protein